MEQIQEKVEHIEQHKGLFMLHSSWSVFQASQKAGISLMSHFGLKQIRRWGKHKNCLKQKWICPSESFDSLSHLRLCSLCTLASHSGRRRSLKQRRHPRYTLLFTRGNYTRLWLDVRPTQRVTETHNAGSLPCQAQQNISFNTNICQKQ